MDQENILVAWQYLVAKHHLLECFVFKEFHGDASAFNLELLKTPNLKADIVNRLPQAVNALLLIHLKKGKPSISKRKGYVLGASLIKDGIY
jgi:hypothetical protein